MGLLNLFGEKPVPYKIYTLQQAIKFMEKYNETFDFPATEKGGKSGFMAVPKR